MTFSRKPYVLGQYYIIKLQYNELQVFQNEIRRLNSSTIDKSKIDLNRLISLRLSIAYLYGIKCVLGRYTRILVLTIYNRLREGVFGSSGYAESFCVSAIFVFFLNIN